jgi:hypothetical protein
MKCLWLLALLCLPCFAGKITSFYSSTAEKQVAVISSSELEKDPEIDHFEHLCPGYGGYELLHRGGDLRSHLDVRYQGKTSDLYGATMNAGRGHFVHKANDTVEWRGILEGNVFTPYAIIYRVSAQDPENEQKSRSTLIVVALHQGQAKILGTASGNNEDADAKKLADQAAPKGE